MSGASDPVDVIVVGGGIVGIACAEAATAQGLTVRLFEQDRIGSGTTSAGMGHVVQIPGAMLPLIRYSQRLWRVRASEWAGQVPIRPAGTVWLARDAEDVRKLDALEDAYARAEVPTERWDASELRAQEPAVGRDVSDGLRVKDDLLVDPPSATLRLRALTQARKGVVMEGMRVEQIVDGGVRLAEGTTVRAHHVVVASGVESSRLLPELGIYPRKGHIVQLGTPAGYVHSQLAEAGYALGTDVQTDESISFNVHPAPSGGLWVGASRQSHVESSEVEDRIVDRLIERAGAYLDRPTQYPVIRRWTGFRPASPDHRPFIGFWPGRQDLLVAAGHEGLGVTTSLATGQLVADLLQGRRSEVDRAPFALEGRVGEAASPRKGNATPSRRRGAR